MQTTPPSVALLHASSLKNYQPKKKYPCFRLVVQEVALHEAVEREQPRCSEPCFDTFAWTINHHSAAMGWLPEKRMKSKAGIPFFFGR
jgi:hypothetical protein